MAKKAYFSKISDWLIGLSKNWKSKIKIALCLKLALVLLTIVACSFVFVQHQANSDRQLTVYENKIIETAKLFLAKIDFSSSLLGEDLKELKVLEESSVVALLQKYQNQIVGRIEAGVISGFRVILGDGRVITPYGFLKGYSPFSKALLEKALKAKPNPSFFVEGDKVSFLRPFYNRQGAAIGLLGSFFYKRDLLGVLSGEIEVDLRTSPLKKQDQLRQVGSFPLYIKLSRKKEDWKSYFRPHIGFLILFLEASWLMSLGLFYRATASYDYALRRDYKLSQKEQKRLEKEIAELSKKDHVLSTYCHKLERIFAAFMMQSNTITSEVGKIIGAVLENLPKGTKLFLTEEEKEKVKFYVTSEVGSLPLWLQCSMNIQEVNVNEIISEAITLCLKDASKRRIILEEEKTSLLEKITTEKFLLEILLISLLFYSLSRVPKGGIIRIIKENLADEIKIKIIDRGFNVEPDKTKKITQSTEVKAFFSLDWEEIKELVLRLQGHIEKIRDLKEENLIILTLPREIGKEDKGTWEGNVYKLR